ncbi:MAG: four helix bundle protein [Bacteroidia bacterium]
MAKIENFEDLISWQKARVLDKEVFSTVRDSKISTDFALKDQILRSSGSIMDNITEGFERSGRREFIQFLAIAKGSCGELRSQFYRAFDRNYITSATFDKLKELCSEVSKIINGLITYLNKSEIKGSKFKETQL